MADIKTRDVTRGTIKSIDRAASSMHRMKEEVIRSKAVDIGGRRDDESGQGYAQESIEHHAGDLAAYAARAGAELIQQNRQKTLKTEDNAEQIQQAYKEQGVKTILDRREKSRMADAEVELSKEEHRLSDRIRSVSGRRSVEQIQRKRGGIAKNRQNPLKSEELIQRQRKEYTVRRILARQENRGRSVIAFLKGGSINGGRRASTASRYLRFMWENARTAVMTAGTGAAATVIILIMLVFFGIGVITFSNNSPDTSVTEDTDEIVYFIPDLAGSPTRQAIVRAAAREVGNVGGEKFWRWYGFNSHVHWCACFTSYIAYESGCIQSGICPKSALVGDWISFYKKQHRWAGGNYIPHSGDFIVFDWEGDGEADHIGIVESCDGKTVYTIEGNSRDVCKRKSYARGSGLIYGYCLPAYSSVASN